MAERIQLLVQWRQECPELTSVDWVEVLSALVAHVRRTFHVDENQMIGGCGKTSQEIAIEVCEQFVMKEIQWNRRDQPDTGGVIALLKMAVTHDYIDQAYRRKNGKRVSRAELSLDVPKFYELASSSETIEGTFIRAQGDGYVQQLFQNLEEVPDRDPKFPDFVRMHMNEMGIKPSEVAQALGISVTAVYQMRKRLERRLRTIVPESALKGRLRYEKKEERKRRHD